MFVVTSLVYIHPKIRGGGLFPPGHIHLLDMNYSFNKKEMQKQRDFAERTLFIIVLHHLMATPHEELITDLKAIISKCRFPPPPLIIMNQKGVLYNKDTTSLSGQFTFHGILINKFIYLGFSREHKIKSLQRASNLLTQNRLLSFH